MLILGLIKVNNICIYFKYFFLGKIDFELILEREI